MPGRPKLGKNPPCRRCGRPRTRFITLKNGTVRWLCACTVKASKREPVSPELMAAVKRERERFQYRKRHTIPRWQMKATLIDHHGGKCSRCGYEDNMVALQFHHVDTKVSEISKLIQKGPDSGWDAAVEEARKCLVLCSNCQALEHSNHSDELGKGQWKKYIVKVKDQREAAG